MTFTDEDYRDYVPPPPAIRAVAAAAGKNATKGTFAIVPAYVWFDTTLYFDAVNTDPDLDAKSEIEKELDAVAQATEPPTRKTFHDNQLLASAYASVATNVSMLWVDDPEAASDAQDCEAPAEETGISYSEPDSSTDEEGDNSETAEEDEAAAARRVLLGGVKRVSFDGSGRGTFYSLDYVGPDMSVEPVEYDFTVQEDAPVKLLWSLDGAPVAFPGDVWEKLESTATSGEIDALDIRDQIDDHPHLIRTSLKMFRSYPTTTIPLLLNRDEITNNRKPSDQDAADRSTLLLSILLTCAGLPPIVDGNVFDGSVLNSLFGGSTFQSGTYYYFLPNPYVHRVYFLELLARENLRRQQNSAWSTAALLYAAALKNTTSGQAITHFDSALKSIFKELGHKDPTSLVKDVRTWCFELATQLRGEINSVLDTKDEISKYNERVSEVKAAAHVNEIRTFDVKTSPARDAYFTRPSPFSYTDDSVAKSRFDEVQSICGKYFESYYFGLDVNEMRIDYETTAVVDIEKTFIDCAAKNDALSDELDMKVRELGVIYSEFLYAAVAASFGAYSFAEDTSDDAYEALEQRYALALPHTSAEWYLSRVGQGSTAVPNISLTGKPSSMSLAQLVTDNKKYLTYATKLHGVINTFYADWSKTTGSAVAKQLFSEILKGAEPTAKKASGIVTAFENANNKLRKYYSALDVGTVSLGAETRIAVGAVGGTATSGSVRTVTATVNGKDISFDAWFAKRAGTTDPDALLADLTTQTQTYSGSLVPTKALAGMVPVFKLLSLGCTLATFNADVKKKGYVGVGMKLGTDVYGVLDGFATAAKVIADSEAAEDFLGAAKGIGLDKAVAIIGVALGAYDIYIIWTKDLAAADAIGDAYSEHWTYVKMGVLGGQVLFDGVAVYFLFVGASMGPVGALAGVGLFLATMFVESMLAEGKTEYMALKTRILAAYKDEICTCGGGAGIVNHTRALCERNRLGNFVEWAVRTQRTSY